MTALTAASIDAWVGTVVVPGGAVDWVGGAVDWVGGRMCCGSLRRKEMVMVVVLCRRLSIKCGVRVNDTLR